jgi:hypothetical protein
VYSSLSVNELQEVLGGRALPNSGKKELLIRRLENKDKRSWLYQKSLKSAGLKARKDQDQVPYRFKLNLDNFIGNIIDTTRCPSNSSTSIASEMASLPRKSAAAAPRAKSLPPVGSRSSAAIDVDVESASDTASSQMRVVLNSAHTLITMIRS